ncbi:MAG: hypothetical protein AAFZ15_35005, partial [Bacteroidota bacterium]
EVVLQIGGRSLPPLHRPPWGLGTLGVLNDSVVLLSDLKGCSFPDFYFENYLTFFGQNPLARMQHRGCTVLN